MNVLGNHHNLIHRGLRRTEHAPAETAKPLPTLYGLTLVLAGITADDYLQWNRDPDPPTRTELKLISAQAAPLGNRIELELLALGEPPSHRAAAIAAGFPITPEVIGIHRRPVRASTHARRHQITTDAWDPDAGRRALLGEAPRKR
jgi:hypothetical protein